MLGQQVQPLGAEAIVEQGLARSDAVCDRTLDTFCALLGNFAGNVALTLGARGGIYIGGGIVPRFGDRFFASQFRERFEAGSFADGELIDSQCDGRVIVDHEEIPEYMPAMTMAFTPADPAEVAGLKDGDSIRFRWRVFAGGSEADNFMVTGRVPTAAPVARTNVRRLREGDAVPAFNLVDENNRRVYGPTLANAGDYLVGFYAPGRSTRVNLRVTPESLLVVGGETGWTTWTASCAANMATLGRITGMPPTRLYCLGISPPARSPRPAALGPRSKPWRATRSGAVAQLRAAWESRCWRSEASRPSSAAIFRARPRLGGCRCAGASVP